MKNLIILFMLLPSLSMGQRWSKDYGPGRGFSVQQTKDEGFIITGLYDKGENPDWTDLFLVRTDKDGDIVWTRKYGGNGKDVGYSVQETSDDGFIITGETNDTQTASRSDVYLLKIDKNGDSLWTKTFGGQSYNAGNSVQQTTDGGFIITGIKTINSLWDIYIIKTNETGDTLWTKTYGGDGTDVGWSIKQTTDNGYIITGMKSDNNNTNEDIYLIKIDSNGDSLWTKTFDYSNYESGYSVEQTKDGGFIITGETSISSEPYSYFAMVLIRTNKNGDEIWKKFYGQENGGTFGMSIQQTKDEGYVVVGYSNIFSNDQMDILLIKTDINGDTLWCRTYGGAKGDVGNSVDQLVGGGYIITGAFDLNTPSLCLIKTDEDGHISATEETPINLNNRTIIKIIDFSGYEILSPPSNRPYIELYDNGTVQKKINIR